MKEFKREYYGFVLYLISISCLGISLNLVIYLLWAFIPDQLLMQISTYYPPKYLAIVVPVWIVGLIPFTILMFTSYNLLNTPPWTSFDYITDEHARCMTLDRDNLEKMMDPVYVPELQDVPIMLANRCLVSPLEE